MKWAARYARARRALVLLTGLLCVWLPSLVYGRAGGGGGFSGGGGGLSGGGFSGGGFSGGSHGGGGNGDLGLLILWLIRHPAIGLPVFALLAYMVYQSYSSSRSAHVSSSIRRGFDLQAPLLSKEGEERIRKRDPDFSADALAARCATVFPSIQEAWSAQDMTPVRHFISDGVHERFQLQLEMQQQCLLRNHMSDIVVDETTVVGIQSDPLFDTVHISVSASAVDYLVDTRNNRRAQGSDDAAPFTEVWSFLRRPGARTLVKPGLLEGYCPNCGTALQLTDAVACPSCRALVNSGEYDWVLAEITQAEEWSGPAARAVPGLDAMTAQDSAFNVQHIEDKASVIFWRLRAAEFLASDLHLRKVALPRYLEENASRFLATADGAHSFFADAAVGSVSIAGVEQAGEGAEFDRVHVCVRWSGHPEVRAVPSFMPPDYERSRLYSQDFVLVRRAGVPSSARNILTSAHCPGCGAPQTRSETGECQYCGLAQNDGSSGWVLAEVAPFAGFSVADLATTPPRDSGEGTPLVALSLRDNERLIQCAAAVMTADGMIDEKEKESLRKMAARRGISPSRLEALLRGVREDAEVQAPASGSGEENREFLLELIRMCLADGRVTTAERDLIRGLVEHMQYRDADIDLTIKQERARMYDEARGVIRAARQSG